MKQILGAAALATLGTGALADERNISTQGYQCEVETVGNITINQIVKTLENAFNDIPTTSSSGPNGSSSVGPTGFSVSGPQGGVSGTNNGRLNFFLQTENGGIIVGGCIKAQD